MMRKRIGIVLAPLILLVFPGCSKPTPEELASLAAKGYYDHLIHHEYEKFFEGMELRELMEQEDYRSQLLDGFRQFMAQQQTAHGGIREVGIVRAKTDSTRQCTDVFLTLCFGDSTNEEIVVPMVERNGCWRMR